MKNSQIIDIELSELKPHPVSKSIYRNVMKEIKVLAETIRRIGQLEPIIINQDNYIISGGRRYKAMMFLGRRTIKAIRTHTNSETETAQIVFHNQQRRKTPAEILKEAEAILGILGVNQGRRTDLLTKEQGNIFGKIGRDRYEIAAKVIGDISASTLRRMMDVAEWEKEEKQNKDLGLVDRIITGELAPNRAYSMMRTIKQERIERKNRKKRKLNPINFKDFQLFNKSSALMDEVESNSVQVVFTSPPYYQLRNYGNSVKGQPELGHETTPHKFVKSLANHFSDVKRVLKKEGSFFINIGDTYHRGENLLISNRLLLEMCDKEGWYIVNEIIWKKTNSLPQQTSRRLQPTYEKIFHLVRAPENYTYYDFSIETGDGLRIRRAPGGRSTQRIDYRSDRVTLSRGLQRFRDFLEEEQVRDVITGPNAAMRQVELRRFNTATEHPALMPNYLPLLPILTTSDIGDVVLDTFSGSATTGNTALLLGRKYIGYELNQANHHLAYESLSNLVTEISD